MHEFDVLITDSLSCVDRQVSVPLEGDNNMEVKASPIAYVYHGNRVN